MHEGAAFRRVATLEQHGLVEQVEEGVASTGSVWDFSGSRVRRAPRLDVVQEARPLCKQLAAATGETVNLATLSGNSALYLDQGRRRIAPCNSETRWNLTSRCTPPATARSSLAWLTAAELGHPARPGCKA